MPCCFIRSVFFALGLFSALLVQADEQAALGLKGFATLGMARSNSDQAEFVRDLSQSRGIGKHWSGEIDSLLGVQANLRLGERSEAVVQGISRYRTDGSFAPELSWAFLRYDFSPNIQVRVGRLAPEFYLLADSRLVGYANVAVRPSVDFYGPLVFAYADGADLSGSFPLGEGLLRSKVYFGRSSEKTGFRDPITWDISGSQLYGAYLDYQQGAWQFRLTQFRAHFATELPLSALAQMAIQSTPALASLQALGPIDLSALMPELSTVGTTSRFDSLGVAYDHGPLQVQAMLGRIRHESETYEDSKAGFILASYRLGEWTPYVGYSQVKSSPVTLRTQPAGPLGGVLQQFAQRLTTGTHLDQHTTTIGLRWDFASRFAFKLQLDSIRGQQDSVFLFRGPDVQWDGQMKVISATLDFVF